MPWWLSEGVDTPGGDQFVAPSSMGKRESRRRQKAVLSKLQERTATQARLRVQSIRPSLLHTPSPDGVRCTHFVRDQLRS